MRPARLLPAAPQPIVHCRAGGGPLTAPAAKRRTCVLLRQPRWFDSTDNLCRQFECQFLQPRADFQALKRPGSAAVFLGKKPEPARDQRGQTVLHKSIHSYCAQYPLKNKSTAAQATRRRMIQPTADRGITAPQPPGGGRHSRSARQQPPPVPLARGAGEPSPPLKQSSAGPPPGGPQPEPPQGPERAANHRPSLSATVAASIESIGLQTGGQLSCPDTQQSRGERP
jgi:hypothetical protein